MEVRHFLFRRSTVVAAFTILLLYGCFTFMYIEFHVEKGNSIIFKFGKYKFTIDKDDAIQEDWDSNTNTLTGKGSTNHKEIDSGGTCPVLALKQKYTLEKHDLTCVEHQPSISGCKFARKTYVYDTNMRTCNTDPRLKICHFKKKNLKCSLKACGMFFIGEVLIHIFDKETGEVRPLARGAKNDEELRRYVLKYAAITVSQGYDFLFLSCEDDEKRTQLLLIDRMLFKKSKYTRKKKQSTQALPEDIDLINSNEKININMVLLDSIARSHFYRSLRKTINAFNQINSSPRIESEVLDFELFQALHGHTTENFHALFTGNVFPNNMTDSEREKQATSIEKFMKHFHDAGYEILYQDDMCWEAIWGIRTDLGGARDWNDLIQKLKAAYIDDTGLLFASCKMIRLLGVDHTFNLEEDEKVCYNGRQQDAYYLQYLYNRFKEETEGNSKNKFAFSALNVAHDSGGLRIQTIDDDLSRYVLGMSQVNDTLTLIFADHGNTYTDYVYLDMEGRYEMFHPSLFMIVPKTVKEYLGESVMQSLRLNQKRLLTMIDLHHGLKSLTNNNQERRGIFSTLSSERSCSDLPLRMPNLCVCEGWNSPVQNTTEFIGHLEYAVGKLNNRITRASTYGKCKRLLPTLFQNVLQRKEGDVVMTMFDIHTTSGYASENKDEKFSVEVKSRTSGTVDTYEMELVNSDRISAFGDYRKCSDADQTFRYCVCDQGEIRNKGKNKFEKLLHKRTSPRYELFDGNVKEDHVLIIKNKLVLNVRKYIERKYDDDNNEIDPFTISVTFEIANLPAANARPYFVSVKFKELSNMKCVSKEDCSVQIDPNTVMYLCTIYRKWSIWQGEYDYKVEYEEM